MNSTSNRYFICKMYNPLKAISWDIYDTDNVLDPSLVYFGKVFQVVDKLVTNLTFYLTWSLEEVSSYGQDVVVIILGDEVCRIPKYIYDVKAVFKTLETRPILGCNPLRKPSYIKIMSLMQFLKIWVVRLPGLVNYLLPKFKYFQLSSIDFREIYDVPLGYYKQTELNIELNIKNIKERHYDVFFAGSFADKKHLMMSIILTSSVCTEKNQ